MTPLLRVNALKKHYELPRLFKASQTVKALDGVSFEVKAGKTLAVVGESGCGKSTLAKVLIQIEPKTSGEIFYGERALEAMPRADAIQTLQMIFQDPYSSINPRKKAWQIISEPLVIHHKVTRAEARAKAIEAMTKVGLRPEFADRYPHMFSGGQRQRIGIARAMILNPKILICDEPVSALDVSIQAQVLNLLMDLQDQFGLSYIFISHDLSVVRHIADEILVMYLGKIVEQGPRDQIFNAPQHPYTRALLAAAPALHTLSENGALDVKPVKLSGELPSPLDPPPGCSLHKRCPYAVPRCATELPALRPLRDRLVACHEAERIDSDD